ncbi:MAG: hypothetical protein KKA42_07635, partial [candidate division Zixibacteria bacterium]|nr:hypothetical protein [candidate division Zixibacteria bacterium]
MNGTEWLKEWVRRHPRVRELTGRLGGRLPASMRLGRDFLHWYAFFQESETWTPEQHRAFQLERLRDLLGELRETSDFYRERLGGLTLSDCDSIAWLQKHVPALTRDQFMAEHGRILNRTGVPKNARLYTSSGTTGKSVQFYHTAEDDQREWAAICHQWSRVGYDPAQSRRAEFRGPTRSGELTDVSLERNLVRCSTLHLRK